MDAILKEARPAVGYRAANDGAFGYRSHWRDRPRQDGWFVRSCVTLSFATRRRLIPAHFAGSGALRSAYREFLMVLSSHA